MTDEKQNIPEIDRSKTTTAAGWKKAGIHTIVTHTGEVVKVKIPDLPRLIEAGEFPQHLLDAALAAAGEQTEVAESTPKSIEELVERIKQQREFSDKVVELTVVEPKLTAADVADIPFEDRDFVVAIALRLREYDAEGNHISGLDRSQRFRTFRGLTGVGEDVEGL
jgi:hypothetical protein